MHPMRKRTRQLRKKHVQGVLRNLSHRRKIRTRKIRGGVQMKKQLVQDLTNSSTILLIVGSRGSGKSAAALHFAEEAHKLDSQKNICTINFPNHKALPSWIRNYKDINTVPRDSLVVVDEAALTFNARNHQKKENKDLASLLPILRHKDSSAIFLTQNTGLSDVNLVRLVDSILVKQPSLLQVKTERPAMKAIMESATEKLKGKDKSYGVLTHLNEETLIQTPLPTFWNSKISKNQNQEKTITEPTQIVTPEKLPSNPTPLSVFKYWTPKGQKYSGLKRAWQITATLLWIPVWLFIKALDLLNWYVTFIEKKKKVKA